MTWLLKFFALFFFTVYAPTILAANWQESDNENLEYCLPSFLRTSMADSKKVQSQRVLSQTIEPEKVICEVADSKKVPPQTIEPEIIICENERVVKHRRQKYRKAQKHVTKSQKNNAVMTRLLKAIETAADAPFDEQDLCIEAVYAIINTNLESLGKSNKADRKKLVEAVEKINLQDIEKASLVHHIETMMK